MSVPKPPSNHWLSEILQNRKHEDSGGAFRMQIYSPFVMINKTGFPMKVKATNGKEVAGQANNGTCLY